MTKENKKNETNETTQEAEIKEKMKTLRTELNVIRNKDKFISFYKNVRKETAKLRTLTGTEQEKKQVLLSCLENVVSKLEESINKED